MGINGIDYLALSKNPVPSLEPTAFSSMPKYLEEIKSKTVKKKRHRSNKINNTGHEPTFHSIMTILGFGHSNILSMSKLIGDSKYNTIVKIFDKKVRELFDTKPGLRTIDYFMEDKCLLVTYYEKENEITAKIDGLSKGVKRIEYTHFQSKSPTEPKQKIASIYLE